MDQEFMKKKAVFPLVVSMALPMTISMLVNALYNIVDSYFVAKISEDAMTALSLVYPIQNLITSVAVGFGIGINAVIAYYLGKKEGEKANVAASLGILCNVFHGIFLTVLCFLGIKTFLGLFTKDTHIITLGMKYSYIVILFSVPNMIAIGFEKIFQSVGRMKVSMICMMIGCLTNIILDPFLIFGIGIFPKMGMEGAAIATGLGQLATLAGYVFIYFWKPISVKVSGRYLRFEKSLLKKIYGIGIPATLNMALPSLQVSALNGILSLYSTSYVLVLGAYYKLQTFLYLTANGVVQGMRPLISYNYGAREYKRVKNIFSTALGIIGVVMALGTVLCLGIPDRLMGIFSAKKETIEMGANALRLISIGFVVSSVSVTVSGTLEALGKGSRSLIISLMRYVVVIIPLGYGLSRLLGPSGVWHGFWITEFITAAVSAKILEIRKLSQNR